MRMRTTTAFQGLDDDPGPAYGREIKSVPPSQISESDYRDAVLPGYDGSSPDEVLAAGVSREDAIEAFKQHYQSRGDDVVVESVSSADVVSREHGKKLVWLPLTYTRSQLIQNLQKELEGSLYMINSQFRQVAEAHTTLERQRIRHAEVVAALKKKIQGYQNNYWCGFGR